MNMILGNQLVVNNWFINAFPIQRSGFVVDVEYHIDDCF